MPETFNDIFCKASVLSEMIGTEVTMLAVSNIAVMLHRQLHLNITGIMFLIHSLIT